MTIVFRDTFTEASTISLSSHTPEIGGAWSSAAFSGGAGISVVGGAGYAEGLSFTSTSQWVNAADIAAVDGEYELTFSLSNPTSSDARSGYFARLTDSSGSRNGYQIYFQGGGNPILYLQRIASGSGSSVGSWTLPSSLTAGSHTIRTVFTGALIEIYFDDILRISYTDGSPIAGLKTGVICRIVDRLEEFTITSAAVGNTAPTFDGPNIDAISGTEGVALSSLDVSARFSDAESALTYSAVGAWPAGVTVSSAGVISGTPTTAGTYASLQVRATDTGALTADSNTFTITVAAAPAVNTVTVTEPLKNNTGTLLASASGVRVAVLQAADLVSVHEDVGLTTNASGLLSPISDVAIVQGASYHVAIKLADGSVGITGPIVAS